MRTRALVVHAIVALALVLGWPPSSAVAQQRTAACTASIRPASSASNARLRFQRRNKRCEGLYATLVAVPSALRVIGFHKGSFANRRFGPQAPQVIARILAPSSQIPSLRLRALATTPTVFYAMDTEEIPATGVFSWPSEILASPGIGLAANQLALVACTANCEPRTATFYPVSTIEPRAEQQSDVTVLIASAVRLVRLEYSLIDGQNREVIKNTTLRGPFGPGIAIPIVIATPYSGNAKLRLKGTSQDGSPSFLEANVVWPRP